MQPAKILRTFNDPPANAPWYSLSLIQHGPLNLELAAIGWPDWDPSMCEYYLYVVNPVYFEAILTTPNLIAGYDDLRQLNKLSVGVLLEQGFTSTYTAQAKEVCRLLDLRDPWLLYELKQVLHDLHQPYA